MKQIMQCSERTAIIETFGKVTPAPFTACAAFPNVALPREANIGFFIVPPPAPRVSAAPLLDDGAPDPAVRREVIATRYGCGDTSLIDRKTFMVIQTQ